MNTILLILLAIVVIYAFVDSFYLAPKREKQRELERQEWYDEQAKLPLFYVEVTTPDGTFNTEPEMPYYSRYWGAESSESKAYDTAHRIKNNGYTHRNVTYPVAQILKITVKQVV